ncbi:MAG: outer membrane beta-barrel protein [Nitrosomonadales bacterium]|nr:outer membrane beta-barrel protein [Nitrosomonadales bacterium]
MKKLLAVALLSTTLSAPAFAADSPVYAGVLLGDSYVGVLGGYQIDKMFSVEAHYATVLHPSISIAGTTIKTDTSMIGVDLVALLPWKVQKVPELTFFAKGGMDYVSNKVTTSNGGGSTSMSTRETKLSLGGGAQYDLNKSFSARVGAGVMGYRNELYVTGIFRF